MAGFSQHIIIYALWRVIKCNYGDLNSRQISLKSIFILYHFPAFLSFAETMVRCDLHDSQNYTELNFYDLQHLKRLFSFVTQFSILKFIEFNLNYRQNPSSCIIQVLLLVQRFISLVRCDLCNDQN